MTTTEKTTETTPQHGHRKVDATSFRDQHPMVFTAVVALAAGLAAGAVVATAMGGDRDHYLRFVGFAFLVAIVTVGVKAYRTHVSPGRPPVVEETPAPEVETTS